MKEIEFVDYGMWRKGEHNKKHMATKNNKYIQSQNKNQGILCP